MDRSVVYAMKVAATMYCLAAPLLWKGSDVDLTIVYAAASVMGAVALLIDVSLGLIVLAGVLITSLIVRSHEKPKDHTVHDWTKHSYAPARQPRTEAFDVELSPIAADAAAAAPPPPPDSDVELACPAVNKKEPVSCSTATDLGPRFLLDPAGQFGHVSAEQLDAAQTNSVGGSSYNTVYCPLGDDSYSAQGVTKRSAVAPATW